MMLTRILLKDVREYVQRVQLLDAETGWATGYQAAVSEYMIDLLDELDDMADNEEIEPEDMLRRERLEAALLRGAPDWTAYSAGGFSLVDSDDIRRRLRVQPGWYDSGDLSLLQAAALKDAARALCYLVSMRARAAVYAA